MIWKYREEVDRAAARELAGSLGKPVKYAQFLLGRGFRSREEIREFVAPELRRLPLPETMPNMRKAVECFLAARERGDTVAVAGDYDADGLTATAILVRVLGALGYKVITRIPNRLRDGYGLSAKAVEGLHAKGARLLVTVDCGVSDLEAVVAANRLGLPVVVTDHHRLPPQLPPAAAIVNPHLGGGWERSPMAGVGVAFMLAWAVQRALRFKGVQVDMNPPLVENLALVALGTVADMAPLTGVNRTLVRHGLRYLSNTSWPSLSALKSSSRLDDPGSVSARDVGFKLAPKLNAAGRLGSAEPALELLVTEDPLRARALAESLESINRDRYEGQKKLLALALSQLEASGGPEGRTVVLAGESWPKGLLGLVASRVAEVTRRPTVLLSLEGSVAAGSGRGAPGFDLLSALREARDLCRTLGGHSEAAGLSLDRDKLPAFKEAFERGASRQPGPPDDAELEIDLELDLDDLQTLAGALADLEPFGQGHPAPVAVLRGVKVTDAAPCRSGGDRHLNFRFTDGFRTFGMTGFNLAPRLAEVAPELDLAVIFDPEASRFGSWSPSWRLLDFKRPGQSPSPWASWRPAAVGEAAGGPAAPGAVSAKARKAAGGPEGAGPADAAPDGQAAGEGGAGAAGATAAPSGGPPAAGLLRRPQLPQGGAL